MNISFENMNPKRGNAKALMVAIRKAEYPIHFGV
jgi:hypothetical protein